MNHKQIKTDWESRCYSFGIFKDPPGQVWEDFFHRTDELVVLVEGEIEHPKGGVRGVIPNKQEY